MKDEEPHVRRGAAQALFNAMNRDASAAVPLLLDLLKDSDKSVRAAAMHVFVWSPPPKAALSPLLLARDDSELRVRRLATEGITRMRNTALNTLPVLIRRLSEREQRVFAACAPYHQGAEAREAIPELEKMVKDNDVKARVSAAWALWRIDDRVDLAREIFEAATSNADQEVQSEARYYLELIRSENKEN